MVCCRSYLTVFTSEAWLAVAKILRAFPGAGTLVQAGGGETGVDLGVAQRALVSRGTDTLEPGAQGDADTFVLAGNRETVVHQQRVQSQTFLNINNHLNKTSKDSVEVLHERKN